MLQETIIYHCHDCKEEVGPKGYIISPTGTGILCIPCWKNKKEAALVKWYWQPAPFPLVY